MADKRPSTHEQVSAADFLKPPPTPEERLLATLEPLSYAAPNWSARDIQEIAGSLPSLLTMLREQREHIAELKEQRDRWYGQALHRAKADDERNAAHAAGRRAGLEEAAQWHEVSATQVRGMPIVALLDETLHSARAETHERSATAIRALKDKEGQ